MFLYGYDFLKLLFFEIFERKGYNINDESSIERVGKISSKEIFTDLIPKIVEKVLENSDPFQSQSNCFGYVFEDGVLEKVKNFVIEKFQNSDDFDDSDYSDEIAKMLI